MTSKQVTVWNLPFRLSRSLVRNLGACGMSVRLEKATVGARAAHQPPDMSIVLLDKGKTVLLKLSRQCCRCPGNKYEARGGICAP